MENQSILRLADHVETFLDKWSEGMDRAGYLKYTTAKREDCILSFDYFLGPLVDHMRSGAGMPSFGDLLENKGGWTGELMEVSRRHRFRGVTAEMFFGCFKTFIHAMEELVLEFEGSIEEKMDALGLIRKWGDAFETKFVGDWTDMTQQDALEKLADTNRQLTLEKNKYENILSATSDLVLVTDAVGTVMEANAAAIRYLGQEDLLDERFWVILGLEGRDMEEVIRYYPCYICHEITLFEGGAYFHLQIIPLQTVSLASRGYMILLTDVSCLVGQRESLERRVNERTAALLDTEKQYSSLFQAAGESILLINIDFRIVEANRRSGQIFGMEPERLRGCHCNDICPIHERINPEKVIRNLDEGQIWKGEMVGKRSTGEHFPMAVTINRIELDTMTLFHVLVRDITKTKELEDSLRDEKLQLEEMNITLRNVMKSIDQESHELKRTVAQKVEDLLLPALGKVESESAPQVRKGYIDIIRNQLTKLTVGIHDEQDSRLLKLTPTEMKICQFIQAGSSTKDIAESMCLSIDTILTHRKNIRKKLGLRGRHVNLFTFLNSPEPRESHPAVL